MKIFLVFLLNISINGIFAEWIDPPLTKIEDDRFNIDLSKTRATITIIETDTFANIFELNYKGTDPPQVTFDTKNIDSKQFLNLQHLKESDYWIARIGNNLDYEVIKERLLRFDYNFELDGYADSYQILITVTNIDDEKPTVIQPAVCEMRENHLDETCDFIVVDNDGKDFQDFIFNFETSEEIFEFEPDGNMIDNQRKFKLKLKQMLDYETNIYHVFNYHVTDSAENQSPQYSFRVKVKDEPDTNPFWTKAVLDTYNFDEEKEYKITFSARDGDLELNHICTYSLLIDEEHQDKFNLNKNTGELVIKKLDREADGMPSTFETKLIADDGDQQLNADIVFQLTDTNDNPPKISISETKYTQKEETVFIIEFEVNDIDDTNNAYYDIEIIDIPDEAHPDPTWTSAFSVIPRIGTQYNKIEISVVKPDQLNYDRPVNCMYVNFKIVAKEKGYIEGGYMDSKDISITITNEWDETPEFTNPSPKVEVKESIKKGERLGQDFKISYDDKDANDEIKLEIHSDFLGIDEDGIITVTKDNAFNFEFLQSLSVQVTATDLGGLVASVLLAIQVIDVNDERPTMQMPSKTPSIMENSKKGDVLDGFIIGQDQDQDAVLEFSIIWEESVAQKSSREITDQKIFRGCLSIELNKDNNEWNGQLVVTGTPNIDYEEFDMLLLMIQIEDLKTDEEYKETSSTFKEKLYISINDEDDTAPKFTTETLNAVFRVEENSIDQSIGKLVATDVDSNYTYYYLEAEDKSILDLVVLNENTGEITVACEDKCIGNNPKNIDYETYKEFLNYTMIASDKLRNVTAPLTINVLDKNDNSPMVTYPSPLISNINESSTGDVVAFKYDDKDTRVEFKEAWFTLDINDKEFFTIDPEKGILSIKEKLDCYVFGMTKNIKIIMQDNYKDNYVRVPNDNTNKQDIFYTINLKDENNHNPMLNNNEEWSYVDETDNKGKKITELSATDMDFGENAECSFELIKATNRSDDNEVDFFKIEENYIIINADLLDKWGDYELQINVIDHGIPPLKSIGTKYIRVNDINQAPTITFPEKDYGLKDYILKKEQKPNSRLRAKNKDGYDVSLPDFTGDDKDQGINATLQFSIEVNNAPNFYMQVADAKSAYLALKDTGIDGSDFKATLFVKDGQDSQDSRTFTITMELGNVPPEFSPQEGSISIKETEEGLINSPYTLPVLATDKNIENGEVPPDHIYYIILGDTYNDIFIFKDPEIPKLTLLKEIDYEEIQQYEIKILASNEPKPTGIENENSVFTLTIEVEDVNDCSPIFIENPYLAGVEVYEKNGKLIKTVLATDQDKDDEVYYEKGDITVSDESLNFIKEKSAITVDNKSGDVHTGFDTDGKMKGYFEVQLFAFDKVKNKGESKLKVYVVSNSDRMKFTFTNSLEEVNEYRNFIEQTFSSTVEFSCTIDTIQREIDQDQVAQDTITYIITYFIDIDSNTVKGAEEIQRILNNMATMEKIKNILGKNDLILSALENVSTSDDGLNDTLKTTLIVVSVVLGVLLIILFGAFFFRTRSLTKRLEALSTTKFGSQNSGINRTGLTVPNTNIHEIEGSNPVWQRDIGPEIETISQGSGDSDLIGIEDNPEFYSSIKPYEQLNGGPATTWGLEGPLGLESFASRRESVNPLAAAASIPITYDEEDDSYDSSHSVPTTEL